MLRADELTVVHHDDTVSHFTDVTYMIGREGLRVITATGDEKAFPQHDILTTIATARVIVPHQRRPITYYPDHRVQEAIAAQRQRGL